ncbi:MAG TPA: ABC transporter ATP-binding protein [Bacillales bacterium]|jgi:ABC-type polysaccharide/polyol phosphate transport system ATPase subunit|nr:ABC transporter ATP-binding protein [Bacillales bacterium]
MNAIEVKDLHIEYKALKRTSVKQAFFSLYRTKVKIFEAIRGVTFNIKKGEILGVIGKNGSGKSTLLRALAGIFAPNAGTINRFGNSVALLSMGVGFKNNLSGRENIYLSGLLMGYSLNQIRDKIDEIIEFSELGDFIDMPVKTYSSGMHSKLAFSITAIMEADVILVDEVLSVGDAKFKKKSYKKMKDLITDESKTVVLVSHSMDMIRKLCNRVIWLDDGKIVMQGTPDEVIKAYEDTYGKD